MAEREGTATPDRTLDRDLRPDGGGAGTREGQVDVGTESDTHGRREGRSGGDREAEKRPRDADATE